MDPQTFKWRNNRSETGWASVGLGNALSSERGALTHFVELSILFSGMCQDDSMPLIEAQNDPWHMPYIQSRDVIGVKLDIEIGKVFFFVNFKYYRGFPFSLEFTSDEPCLVQERVT